MNYLQIRITRISSVLNSYKFSLSFFAWIAFISFLSLYEFSPNMNIEIEIPHIDKVVHFFFYFIATFLACLFIRERSKGNLLMGRAMIYSAIFLAIYGAVIEVLQAKLTSVRDGDIYDMMANLAGILLSLLVTNYIFSSNSGLNWRY